MPLLFTTNVNKKIRMDLVTVFKSVTVRDVNVLILFVQLI